MATDTIHFPRDPREMTADEVWAVLEATPGFNERMAESKANLEAGGGIRFEVPPRDPDDEPVIPDVPNDPVEEPSEVVP